MAYMDQAKKKVIADKLKKVVPKGWKYSLAVDNYSAIVFTISSAPIDLLAMIDDVGKLQSTVSDKGYVQVNHFYLETFFKGDVLKTFKKIVEVLNYENYDNSDSQTDYFDVGHYVNVNIGKYNKSFQVK